MQLIRKTVMGLALGAAALTASSPAMADGWRGHRGGGDTTGAAIAGGIVGLAVGAAIASSNDRDYRDDRYYYREDYPRYRTYYYYRDYPRPYYRNDYRGGWNNGWRGHEWREHRGYRGRGGWGHRGW